MIKLRTINKIIQYSGFRLAVDVDWEHMLDENRKPTLIGFVWYGWKPKFL